MAISHETTDVIIIGGGPAGLSSALWCVDLGLKTVLIEKERSLGGQLHRIHNPIENYLGLRSTNGAEMLAHFERSVEDIGFTRMMHSEVIGFDIATKSVALADGAKLSSKAVIIATGVRRKRLGVPGEDEFRGKGVMDSGVKDRDLVAGKNVLIVGGGDAAMENALLLSEVATSVRVAYRRARPTSRHDFLEMVDRRENVTLLPETILKRISGNSVVEKVELEDISTNDKWTESVSAVLIRIGVEPNSDFVSNILDRDERGFIKVDSAGETNIAGVFAVGDVANPLAPTISTATGTAATAAKAIYDALQRGY